MRVKTDISQNRLYIKVKGQITKREYEKIYTDVRFSVADLKAGFNVIVDYSESNIVQLSGMSTFRKLMNYLIKNGVGEVVRVVNDESLLYKQVKNLSQHICGYKPSYVRTIEEAETILASSKRRREIRFHANTLPSVEYSIKSQVSTGKIVNISTSGCAIKTNSQCPPIDENTTLTFSFKQAPDTENTFKFLSRVVSTNDTEFAVEFVDLKKDQQDRLLNCLLQEIDRDL